MNGLNNHLLQIYLMTVQISTDIENQLIELSCDKKFK